MAKLTPKSMSTPFSNNRLNTLFPLAELKLNGRLISHSNNCYLQSEFLEVVLNTDTEGKKPGENVRNIFT